MPRNTPARDIAAERIAELRAAAANCREILRLLQGGKDSGRVARIEAAQRLAADAIEAAVALAESDTIASYDRNAYNELIEKVNAFRSPPAGDAA